jgi:hypothetical protein
MKFMKKAPATFGRTVIKERAGAVYYTIIIIRLFVGEVKGVLQKYAMIPLKPSSLLKWPMKGLKHNHIKNGYPLIINRFSLTGRRSIWYILNKLNLLILTLQSN